MRVRLIHFFCFFDFCFLIFEIPTFMKAALGKMIRGGVLGAGFGELGC